MAEEKITIQSNLADFKEAYEYKKKLIERQLEDFEFRLGKQWMPEDEKYLREAKVLPVTDNRIALNIHLLTGLERQNRSDFKAFPEGEEDSVSAHVATALFKNVIKQSEGEFIFSEMFEDGVTCGESYIELYLDSTFNLLNPKPRWKKINFDCIFPEPGWKEYDFSDAAHLFKYTKGVKKNDLISLYPEKKKKLEKLSAGEINPSILTQEGIHQQPRDYGEKSESVGFEKKGRFDLLERYYKKWVEKIFVVDLLSGELQDVEPKDGDDRTPEELAKAFVKDVTDADPSLVGRYKIIERLVPEIWVYAVTGGLEEPLADERAWFYPKWKGYGIIPYLGRWTNAPLKDDDRHLNIQGVVHGVKNAQMVHNKAETLKLRHLNSAANSGWLAEEDSWVDRDMVKKFGSSPSVNLEYKKGRQPPQRIFPMPLQAGQLEASQSAAESIKSQLGINADLLGQQQGAGDSGRLAAIRQRQGIVIVQGLFDNLSRTKKIAGKFLLSQLGEIFDVEAVKKIIGPSMMENLFGQQVMDEMTGQPTMQIDEALAEETIKKVLEDVELGKYDLSVGEAIASESMKIANFTELRDFAQNFPGLVTPDVIIEESQLPPSTKNKLTASMRRQQSMQMLNAPVVAAATKKGNLNGGDNAQGTAA